MNLPAFAKLDPAQSADALRATLAESRQKIAALTEQAQPNWETFIEPMENLSDQVSAVWGPITHLFGVWSTPAWRAAYNQALPEITSYGVELSQDEALFHAYERLAAHPAFAGYSPTRRKVVGDALRDFRLSGIALPAAQKARYKTLSLRLSELQSKFEENIMDCTQAWQHQVTDEAELAGMTDSAKASAKAKAEAKQLDGWLLTLDFPSYDAVISRCENRALRQKLYTAYATRAADSTEHDAQFDNTALMREILDLRQEQARLLGFNNFAELSLATKMAESPAEVETFLLDLARRARAPAEAELQSLKRLAAQDGIAEFAAWDMAFYSERLREQTLGLSDESLRPYFPFPQVLQGLFDLVRKLFGVRIEPLTGVETWHPDVGTYELIRDDGSGERVGQFYLDPYARPDTKRGGAWMDECIGRRRLAQGLQIPVAYLVCNFTPPAPGQPALLTHDEVLTLFHEFGHGLHHLLTQVEEGAVAGIRGVEWDAVELPSQFMENWAYEPETLQLFARHWITGEPMPEKMMRELRRDRQFQTGLATLRQVEFALFDLRLHRDHAAGASVEQTLKTVRDTVAVIHPPAFNRMPWSFSHIFAGGYAAGYYSYKWAEVLSSDAFAAFEETQFSPETGHRFRDTILAAGSSKPAMDNFVAFRQRKPTIDALLRHGGLVENENAALLDKP